ncbi:MAG: TldD/PmbA family protein [Oscillospiraceae bacterium]|jgi:TldD protein|nr:TldD/PmbA family protein [Oscillospiraceae bacterium]
MLQDTLTPLKPKLTGHTELRVQRNISRDVSINKGNIVSNGAMEVTGLSARVYRNGYWGFASSPELGDKSADEVIRSASKNAEFLTSRLGTKAPQLSVLPHTRLTTKSEFINTDQKPLLDFAKELDAYIVKKFPNLVTRRVYCETDAMEKVLVTSDGADCYSLIPRSVVSVRLTVEAADGAMIDLGDAFNDGPGFFTQRYTSPELLFPQIDALYENLMKKRDGVYANAGVRDVIIDSALAGILAHEAIGHTTEADLVLGGSVAGAMLGKQVASELVTLVDFANTCDGAECPQPIYVDDEGTVAQDAVIIRDGVLQSFMHNRETAAKFGHEPTGNARAYLFSDEPLIRMRNTAILPGKSKIEDMIASIDDGYWLTRTGNGQADLTSEFMFGVNMGYEIKNGKLGKAIRDTTISGVAFDLLKTVTAVSDEMTWNSSGTCGKKQAMPVGMGGPGVKCRVNIGGR